MDYYEKKLFGRRTAAQGVGHMVLICYIIASLSFMVLFGFQYLTGILLGKLKIIIIPEQYLLQFWCLIAFVFLYIFGGLNGRVLRFDHIFSWNNLIYLFIAVIPCSFMISSKKDEVHKKGRRLLLGISMEIPQRLLMQNFLYFLLEEFTANDIRWLPVVLNALVWAQFILLQEKMLGKKFTRSTLADVASSVWFSLFAGMLYETGGNILLPMLAHGCERLLSETLRQKRGKILKA